MNLLPNFDFILASKSPRRQELLHSLGVSFKVVITEVEENYPDHLIREEIPVYLAELKSNALAQKLKKNDLLITADTIVWLNGEVLGKPVDKNDAIKILQKLSANEHQVITGVCLTSVHKQKTFFSISNVRFKELSLPEIEYYVSEFNPVDKAGAYGIQEWIGFIGITHIEGSFFNVMGLPVQQLYTEILNF